MEAIKNEKYDQMLLDAAADEHGFWCWVDALEPGELALITADAERLGLRVRLAEGDGGDRLAVYIRKAHAAAQAAYGVAYEDAVEAAQAAVEAAEAAAHAHLADRGPDHE